MLQGFLDNAASVHLQGKFVNTTFHDFGKDLLLNLVPVLEQLLDDVVSEDVGHELQCIRLYLAEDLVFLITIGRLNLLAP